MPAPDVADLPTRAVLGIDVVAASTADAVAALDARLDRGERVKLAFLNAHTSNLARADDGYRATLAGFTVLNDGIGLDLGSLLLHGSPFPANLNGSDFVPAYLATTARKHRLYLLGARPGVAEEAAARLLELAPAHELAGVQHGYFDAERTDEVVAAVRASGATLLLVALGNPVQERFIEAHAEATGVELAAGIGALLDFLSGRIDRAPMLFRRLRVEWVWRLLREPRRMWRRYIVGNARFLYAVSRARRQAS